MVQIIQSGPSAATLRQQALNDSLNTIVSGLGDYQKQELQKAQTKRQQALEDAAIQRQQDNADLQSTLKLQEMGVASPLADVKAYAKGTYKPAEISPAVPATPDQITSTQGAQAMSPADVRMQDESGGFQRNFQLGSEGKAAVMGPANPLQNYTEAKKAKIAADLKKQQLDTQVAESTVAKNNAAAKNSNATADFTTKYKPQQLESVVAKNNATAAAAPSKQEQVNIKAINQGLLSARGDTQAQKAQQALVSTENANNLAKKPTWSSQERQLFASELAKIATGGVPGSHEIEALLPSDLATRFNAAKQFFTSDPGNLTDAEYKKRATEYLHDLRATNQAYLDARYEKVLKINNYNGLSEETKNARYRGLPELQSAIAKLEGKQQAPQIQTQSVPAAAHPEASAAAQWAQKNPNDPRAVQILQRLGHP